MFNMVMDRYLQYLTDNPNGYWFKRKVYGWGWVPVKWQGWAVVIIGIAMAMAGVRWGEMKNSLEITVASVTAMMAFVFFFGFLKGEKPRWQWGLPKDNASDEKGYRGSI